jgi:hypothetical protein
MHPTVDKRSAPVSFRLDAVFQQRLEELAKRHDVSLHQEAQRIVIDALSEPDRRASDAVTAAELQVQIDELHTLLRILRSDLATSVSALLAMAGKVTQEEAKSWVAQTFKPARGS